MFYEIVIKKSDFDKINDAVPIGDAVELFTLEAGHSIEKTFWRNGDFFIQCNDGKPDNCTVDIGVASYFGESLDEMIGNQDDIVSA